MIRICTAIGLCLMPVLAALADDASDLKAIHTQAIAFEAAMSKGFDASQLKRMHPKLIAEMGGEEQAVAIIQSTMKAMTEAGLTIERYKTAAPTAIRRNEGKAYAIYHSEMVMKTKTGERLASESYNLAVQEKKDGNWYFIRIKPGQEAMIRKLLPDLPKDFVLPKATGVRKIEE